VSTPALVRKHLVVHGRVQGVWFRGATQAAAREAGVAGWVRNRDDGSVEAVVEGAPSAVEAVVRFCRQGPPAARVVRVDCTDESPEGLSGFRVR
jgi:acylphosphatase